MKPDYAALIHALGLQKPKGVMACPAHGTGKNRALSWMITDDDGLLLHCFAGCTFDEIRRAVGE